MSITHRWRLTIAYVVLAIAVLFAVHISFENQNRIEEQAREQSEKVAAEARRASYENCQTGNELKRLTLELVEQYAASGGPGDFTEVDGFNRLDPELRSFLANLSESGATGSSDRLLRIAREVLVPVHCPSP